MKTTIQTPTGCATHFFSVVATSLNLLEKCFYAEISIVAFRFENRSSASLKLKGTETEASFDMSGKQNLVPLGFVMMLCCDRNPAARCHSTAMLSHLSAEGLAEAICQFRVLWPISPACPTIGIGGSTRSAGASIQPPSSLRRRITVPLLPSSAASIDLEMRAVACRTG